MQKHEKTKVSDIMEQVRFVKSLADRLERDIAWEAKELDSEKTIYNLNNGERYASDIVRLRRELNTLRKMITWRSVED